MVSKPNSSWCCYVRYRDDQKYEYVPVSAVKVKQGPGKKTPFDPKDFNDFVPHKYYSVKTTLGSHDGCPHKYPALILRIAASKEECQSSVSKDRVSFPTQIVYSSSDESDTTGAENNIEEVSNVDVQQAQKENKIKLLNRRNALDHSHRVLLEVQPNAQAPSTSKRSDRNNSPAPPNNIEELLSQIVNQTEKLNEKERNLKKREEEIKKKEEDLKQSEKKTNPNQDEFTEMRSYIDKTMSNLMTSFMETTKKIVEEKLDSFKSDFLTANVATASTVSSRSESSVVHNTNEMVQLTAGIKCRKRDYDIIQSADIEQCTWANTLLRGVFGDRAHLQRLKECPKTPDADVMSVDLVSELQVVYGDWLAKKRVLDQGTGELRPYTGTELQKLKMDLGSYLSSRSAALGSRMKEKTPGSAKRTRAQSAAPADQGERAKRVYLKKGEVPSPAQLAQRNAQKQARREARRRLVGAKGPQGEPQVGHGAEPDGLGVDTLGVQDIHPEEDRRPLQVPPPEHPMVALMNHSQPQPVDFAEDVTSAIGDTLKAL